METSWSVSQKNPKQNKCHRGWTVMDEKPAKKEKRRIQVQDSRLFALLLGLELSTSLSEPKHKYLLIRLRRKAGGFLSHSLTHERCKGHPSVGGRWRDADGGMVMEERGVKCWLSTSALLSAALSGAFFFSLLLSSDSQMI